MVFLLVIMSKICFFSFLKFEFFRFTVNLQRRPPRNNRKVTAKLNTLPMKRMTANPNNSQLKKAQNTNCAITDITCFFTLRHKILIQFCLIIVLYQSQHNFLYTIQLFVWNLKARLFLMQKLLNCLFY